MSIARRILGRLTTAVAGLQKKWYSRYRAAYDHDLSFTEAVAAYPDCNTLYHWMHHYFHYHCPQIVRDHREYFSLQRRGFGEDAFHAMWWLLLAEYKPVHMLEIGVYRGQTISLWGLVCKHLGQSHEIHGISPFSPQGDSVSQYSAGLDYERDVLEAFEYWHLKAPILVKALSADQRAVDHIRKSSWDLIYVDGSHDYGMVLRDYRLSLECLSPGGLLVLDDSGLGGDFRPSAFSFAGHPGPSKVARENACKEMTFLGAVGHNSVFMKRE